MLRNNKQYNRDSLSTQVVLVAHKKNVEYLEKEGSYKNSTKEGTLLKLGKLL